MINHLSPIDAICFDVDGTLSDTDDQFMNKLAAGLKWLRPFLRDQNADQAARRFVMWSESPTNALLGWGDRLGLDTVLAHLGDWLYQLPIRHKKHSFLLISGVKKMLDSLASQYPLAIVSARGKHSTMEFLDQFDLRPYFQVIATAQTQKHTKPFPDPILWAAKQMNVSPQKCLMVGDTVVDILAGKAAGTQTVGVLCGFGEEEELRARGANLILSSTAELTDFLI